VAIEAAANAKATLGTDIMGLRDSIKNNETGILVPPENSEALAGAIQQLLDNKPLRTRLGENGYEWAHRFTWERVAGIQEDFYRSIIKESSIIKENG
jgi:glycosyltransferase involved in cell wall biosynthesis